VGFLDTLNVKPSSPPPAGVEVQTQEDGRTLRIRWNDGKTTDLRARLLRQACPCAACVDEWTNKRTFDPENIPATVSVREQHPVGNYALAIGFSDSHSSGIFPWTLLRQLADSQAIPPRP
jgi:DUF971 family protein